MTNYLKTGKYTKDCPKYLLDKVAKVGRNEIDNAYIIAVLEIIKEEFNPNKYIVSYTRNFKRSRFISVRDVLEIRLRTCGAMATVVASVFRYLGIPTKLINGNYTKKDKRMRHAWNEIYIFSLKKFIAFDITRENFRIDKYHIKKDEWVDWEDLDEH